MVEKCELSREGEKWRLQLCVDCMDFGLFGMCTSRALHKLPTLVKPCLDRP